MRSMLFAALMSLAAASGCSKTDAGASAKQDVQIPSITVDDADKLLAAKQATAVDCNGDNTRKRMGVIPGAVLISDDESFAASELPGDKAQKLVFYCGGPGWHASHNGAVRAKSFGYANVFEMPDGIAGWVKAGKPVQKTGA